MDDYEQITGERCPICGENALTLTETTREIPYFGLCHLFSMTCSSCHYHKADLEAEEDRGPVQYVMTIDCEDDLKTRVVKSGNATVKFGAIGSVESGETSNGYVTNFEGLLNRLKKQIEHLRDAAQAEGDSAAAKKAKNHIKKLTRIMWGQEPLKVTLKDPTGNSAIISDKAEFSKKK